LNVRHFAEDSEKDKFVQVWACVLETNEVIKKTFLFKGSHLKAVVLRASFLVQQFGDEVSLNQSGNYPVVGTAQLEFIMSKRASMDEVDKDAYCGSLTRRDRGAKERAVQV
jgi:hypothetical protein